MRMRSSGLLVNLTLPLRHPAILADLTRARRLRPHKIISFGFMQFSAPISTAAELPIAILDRLPDAFKTADELRSILKAGKTVYKDQGVTCPDSDILYHLVTSPHAGLQPHPHLLTGLKARELADWVVQDRGAREPQLQESIRKGPDALLDLAISVSPLVVDDVVRLYDTLTNLILPVSEELDIIEGVRSTWPSKEDIIAYKNAHPGEPLPRHHEYPEELTILENVTRAMANHWIYCDLFHHTVFNAYALPSSPLPELSATTRHMWMSLCVPDCNDKTAAHPRGILEQLDMHCLYATFGCHMFLAPALKIGRRNYRDFVSYMESAGLETFQLCALKKRYLPTGESRAVFDAINARLGNPPMSEDLVQNDDVDDVWDVSPRARRSEYRIYSEEGVIVHDANDIHSVGADFFVDDFGNDLRKFGASDWWSLIGDIENLWYPPLLRDSRSSEQ